LKKIPIVLKEKQIQIFRKKGITDDRAGGRIIKDIHHRGTEGAEVFSELFGLPLTPVKWPADFTGQGRRKAKPCTPCGQQVLGYRKLFVTNSR
jgi:hypothetical protein